MMSIDLIIYPMKSNGHGFLLKIKCNNSYFCSTRKINFNLLV